VRADSPHPRSAIRITDRSPRWCAKNSNTSAATTSTGDFETTVKNVFRSNAVARNVSALALPATKAR